MIIKNRVYRKKYCFFCKSSRDPTYKDVETLRKFITERGKIAKKMRTGTCAAHQRKLATAIKRARVLALLPFVPRI